MALDDLRTLRRRLGLTQQELAEALDVDQGTVSRWERGAGEPRPRRLLQLRDLLLKDEYRRALARQFAIVRQDLFSSMIVTDSGILAEMSPKGLSHYRETRGIDVSAHLGRPFAFHVEEIDARAFDAVFRSTLLPLMGEALLFRLDLNIRGHGALTVVEPIFDESRLAGHLAYKAGTWEAPPCADITVDRVEAILADDPTTPVTLFEAPKRD